MNGFIRHGAPLLALALVGCTNVDEDPEDTGNVEVSASTGAEDQSAVDSAATHPIGTKLSGYCASCGPVPDPWKSIVGPVPDPWHKKAASPGDGTKP